MAESRALFTAAAALLALGLALHWPALTRRVPRTAWKMAALGALLPLLDPLISRLAGEDQIAALTRMPWFAGPLPGLAVVAAAALAVAIWRGRSHGLWLLAAATTGLALHLGLLALTPWGVPWLAPFSAQRGGLALVPIGDSVLLALLALALLALEVWPRWSRALRWGALGLVALHGALAAAGYAWTARHAPPPAAGALRTIEPDGHAPLAWLVIDRTPERFRVQGWRLGAAEGSPAEQLAPWNDEPLFLRELADPLVFHMVQRTFLHPVAELSQSGSQTTLTVQELTDGFARRPGPRFVLRSDLDGRNRLYRLERFD